METEILEHINRNKSSQVYLFPIKQFYPPFDVDINNINESTLRKINTNIAIKKERQKLRNRIKDVAVGDYVKLTNGELTRVTYIWDDSIQTGLGSFYISKSGFASFSGSLNSGIDKNKFKLTKRRKKASFWFFSEDSSGGNRGINIQLNVRVWEII